MKIIALPDLHEHTDFLPLIRKLIQGADIILLPGDLANGHGAVGAARVIEEIRQLNPSVLAVPGNWDDSATGELMTHKGINLNRRHVVSGGIAFAGVGGSLPSSRSCAYSMSEAEIALALNESVLGLDLQTPLILVCHQPPINTRTDLASSNRHVGSVAVRDFIERVQPLLCFTGHIHESVGIDRIGRTVVINAGPLWEGWFATAEVLCNRVSARCHRFFPTGSTN